MTAERRYIWDPARQRPLAPEPAAGELFGPVVEREEFRYEAYVFVDRLIATLRAEFDLPAWYREPVDLLETLRVEFMFALRPAVRQWLAWNDWHSLAEPRPPVVAPAESVAGLRRDAAALTCEAQIESEPVAAASRKPRGWARIVRSVKSWAFRAYEALENRRLPRSVVPPGASGKTRVLFLDYFANSAKIQLPLWRRLASGRDYQLLYVAARRKVQQALAVEGIAAINLRRCGPVASRESSVPPNWSNIVAEYVGRHWYSDRLCVTPGLEAALLRLADNLSVAKQTALRLAGVFDEFRPDVVSVSGGHYGAARAAELLARRGETLALHLQHGIYLGERESADLLADAVCVWGPWFAERLAQYDGAAKFLPVGSPKHDELLARLHDVPPQSPPLVVFYSPPANSWLVGRAAFEAHLRAFHAAAADCGPWQFVVKPHPSDANDACRNVLAACGSLPNLRLADGDDTYQLLRKASAVVVVSSTVALEALLLGRRVVVMHFAPQTVLPPAVLEQCTRVKEPAELVPALREQIALCDVPPNAGRLWATDGRSLERIVELIERRGEFLSNRKPTSAETSAPRKMPATASPSPAHSKTTKGISLPS